VAVTRALVQAAQDHGARLVTGCTVTGLRTHDGRVVGVESSKGFHPSDTVVLTAGADTPVLCAALGVELPVSASPALLLRFTAPPGLVRTLVATDDLEVREGADGELLLAAQYEGQASQQDLDRAGQDALRRLHATFDDAQEVRVAASTSACGRCRPTGCPFVGPVPGVAGAYVAVLHSGVTLAPAVGRLVAEEVVARLPRG
jgi:glycine/D-amino acid oxidase-like deaminating enzyme